MALKHVSHCIENEPSSPPQHFGSLQVAAGVWISLLYPPTLP